MDRDGLSGFELAILFVGALATVAVVVVWVGAGLALLVCGEVRLLPLSATAEAVGNLPGGGGDPGRAWPAPYGEMMPDPRVYWLCTVLAGVGMAGLVAMLFRWLRPRVGTSRRRPLGVDARPRFARSRDLAPLLVSRPVPGRFIMGRFGRKLVATEVASRGDQRWGWWPRERRRGDRGAVALVGPSRCGKTTAAVSAILEWEGPAVLSSVKADLLGATQGWRSEMGTVRVYDPTSSTINSGESAHWTPLAQAGTVQGAQRAARALCDAAPRDGVEGGMDFWLAQAEILLSSLLYVAHHTKQDMTTLSEWVMVQDRPGELGPGEVRVLLDRLRVADDPEVAAGADEVAKGLVAVWEMEDRTRSSVYATAQTVVWPWSDPGVAASAKPEESRGEASLDLAWLLNGHNTIYLCSPIEDQRRLAPAFGGILNDLISQAYRHVARTGKPIEPALLIVIDEAGNTPLRSLPEYASTLAGLGVLLCTIWQSLAQVQASYGRQADTILTNHTSKVFYTGLSDPASLKYVSDVLGEAEVGTRSRSAGEGGGGRSSQFSTTRVPLTPAHTLRMMRPGDALLVYGTLPPAHIRTRPFYRSRRLAERASRPVRQPEAER